MQLVAFLVNHNRRELLLRAITSLQAQSCTVHRIVVIDNGSDDGSLTAVHALGDSRVQLVEMGDNSGSSGGFHRGVIESLNAGATHILVLDSDVTLAPDCVERLHGLLVTDSRLGVAAPKVYHWDSPSVLQEFGGWIDWDAADLRRSHSRHDEARDGIVTMDQVVDYVPACCLLARREAIEAAGNFDPGWFLYWDDIDWCDRVRAAGFKISACAAARVHHFGGGANKRNLIPVYYGWRNRLTFFRRRTPAERRETTLRAFAEDFLLARFTCRALGLIKTAAMMEVAVEDALNNVFGRRDFAAGDVSLDAPLPPTTVTGRLHRVHHVIGSATRELAQQPNAWLLDRFGKQLPAARAWELRQQFENEKARELPELLSRAM